MENQASKIVFYKSRSLAGRFSAAFDFIENNLFKCWKSVILREKQITWKRSN